MKKLRARATMECNDLMTLRSQRNEAIDAVSLLAKRRVSDRESQAIYARLTLAHRNEVEHKLNCADCRREAIS